MRSLNFYFRPLFLLPILASTSASQTNSMFIDCTLKNYTCGGHSISISYPFRTQHMPNYCGHPKFELNCVQNNSMLAITIDGRQYQVLDIDYSKRVLRLFFLDFKDLLSNHSFVNITIDFDQFTYTSSDTNLTVHFDCPPIGLPPNISFVACVEINSTFQACLVLPEFVRVSVLEMLWTCSSVLIPILESVAERFVERLIDFAQAVQEGFELAWTVGDGWCNACQSSGGVCGYKSSVPNAAACFCLDANGTFITCSASRDGPDCPNR